MRKKTSRRVPQRGHVTWTTRRRRSGSLPSPFSVTAMCSSTRRRCSPHAAHGMLEACGSMIEALVTSIGRSDAPPASSAASFTRTRASFAASRAASRRSVRARFTFAPASPSRPLHLRATIARERSTVASEPPSARRGAAGRRRWASQSRRGTRSRGCLGSSTRQSPRRSIDTFSVQNGSGHQIAVA